MSWCYTPQGNAKLSTAELHGKHQVHDIPHDKKFSAWHHQFDLFRDDTQTPISAFPSSLVEKADTDSPPYLADASASKADTMIATRDGQGFKDSASDESVTAGVVSLLLCRKVLACF